MGLRGSFNLSNNGAGPWAHLVIAWPHGVPIVDAIVDAFFKVPNMTVVSLNNTYMRPNAMSTINCVYAAEMEHPSKRRHILRKTAYIARMTSKAIVTMVLVDTQPAPEPLNSGLYRTYANTRVVAIKRALRAKYNPAGTEVAVGAETVLGSAIGSAIRSAIGSTADMTIDGTAIVSHHRRRSLARSQRTIL